MIKIIVDYLMDLANYNYTRAYWMAVNESQFSAFNIAFSFLEEKEKNGKKPKGGKPVKINRSTDLKTVFVS